MFKTITKFFCRGYRGHISDNRDFSLGRSIKVKGTNITQAYFDLKRVLEESKVRETVRYQERFERPTDKRRRKKKESNFRQYMKHMKKQITLAHDLKKRLGDNYQRPSSEAVLSRPVSDVHNRHLSTATEQQRPSSDMAQHSNYKSPEAIAIDRWFEDLNYYEQTLEQMAKTKLDSNFVDELKAIEQWFKVLSEPERTTALYSLLQLHCSPVQVRFFSTVLTQMANKGGPSTKNKQNNNTVNNRNSANSNSSRPSSINNGLPRLEVNDGLLPMSPNPMINNMYDAYHTSDLQQPIGSPLLRPQTPSEAAISSADWSMNPQELPLRSVSPSPIVPPSRGSSKQHHPASGWDHLEIDKLRPFGSERNYAGSDFSDYSENNGNFQNGNNVAGNATNSSGRGGNVINEKGKIPECVDLTLLNGKFDGIVFKQLLYLDIPAWFRSLRLHKYTPLFENDKYDKIIMMSEKELEERGVAALGARRKMLKVFEMVKFELTKNGISY
ncbi:Flap-structured DNA-binding and RNA-binding protein [Lobulomyces angularis]|nr:Flap-structured DNA-binding and RNA-binding protein [Lobulomyces angularis]